MRPGSNVVILSFVELFLMSCTPIVPPPNVLCVCSLVGHSIRIDRFVFKWPKSVKRPLTFTTHGRISISYFSTIRPPQTLPSSQLFHYYNFFFNFSRVLFNFNFFFFFLFFFFFFQFFCSCSLVPEEMSLILRFYYSCYTEEMGISIAFIKFELEFSPASALS